MCTQCNNGYVAKNLNDYYSFDKWVSQFITYAQVHDKNICSINHHLLVLDGHNSQVTIDVFIRQEGGVAFNHLAITH